MYEVWYTVDGISHVVLSSTLEAAVNFGVNLFLDDTATFEYLIEPGGAIRNDLVFSTIKDEQRERAKRAAKPWVLEMKAQHRDDFWAIVSEHLNEGAANDAFADLAFKTGDGLRLRVRNVAAEG